MEMLDSLEYCSVFRQIFYQHVSTIMPRYANGMVMASAANSPNDPSQVHPKQSGQGVWVQISGLTNYTSNCRSDQNCTLLNRISKHSSSLFPISCVISNVWFVHGKSAVQHLTSDKVPDL